MGSLLTYVSCNAALVLASVAITVFIGPAAAGSGIADVKVRKGSGIVDVKVRKGWRPQQQQQQQ